MSDSKISVFVVDDTAIERTMLKDHLAKYKNMEVTEFANGDYCVKQLIMGNLEEPDLILMDYFLDTAGGNTRDGLDILAKLKEVCPHTKVIMMTGVSNPRIKQLATEKGALDYIIKGPEGYKNLDAALEQHLGVK